MTTKTQAEPLPREWVTLEQACDISAHPSAGAMARWVLRFNRKNPETPVLRRHGKVHLPTLQAALAEDAIQHTPEAAYNRHLAREHGKAPRLQGQKKAA